MPGHSSQCVLRPPCQLSGHCANSGHRREACAAGSTAGRVTGRIKKYCKSSLIRPLAVAPTVSCQLTELLNQTRRPRVLVVGDVMLDRYVWGDVDRISPEAPIPVLNVATCEERLGGAGSVVTLLAALEADVTLATVTADDLEGRKVRQLLEQHQTAADCTLVAADRSTTVKERLLGRTEHRHPQQILRVDRETARPIGDRLAEELLRSIRRHLGNVDVVLVSDYEKGVCAGRKAGRCNLRLRWKGHRLKHLILRSR